MTRTRESFGEEISYAAREDEDADQFSPRQQFLDIGVPADAVDEALEIAADLGMTMAAQRLREFFAQLWHAKDINVRAMLRATGAVRESQRESARFVGCSKSGIAKAESRWREALARGRASGGGHPDRAPDKAP